jgi:hypothetical protein
MSPIISGGKIIEGAIPRGGSPIGASEPEGATGQVRVARARYDFAADGGAIGNINLLPAGSELPAGALIKDGWIDVLTVPTSGGAATLGLGIEAAGDLVAATVISGAPWSTTGRKVIIPVGTVATQKKTTVARNIVAAVGAFALTAGVFDVYLEYVLTA